MVTVLIRWVDTVSEEIVVQSRYKTEESEHSGPRGTLVWVFRSVVKLEKEDDLRIVVVDEICPEVDVIGAADAQSVDVDEDVAATGVKVAELAD